MNDDVRRRVWDDKLAADMRQRYFQRLSARAKTSSDVLRFALVLTSSATALSVLGIIPGGAVILAVVAAVLATISATQQFGCAALHFAQFSTFWGKAHRDYEELWGDLETGALTGEQAVDRLRDIQDRSEPIDQRTAPVRVRRKLLESCLSDAETVATAA